MYIKKKKVIVISIALILVVLFGYFFLTPDLYSAGTRVIGISETLGSENSMVTTYNFVEDVEHIRSKYELGGKMSLQSASERDIAVSNLLLTKKNSKELVLYLKIYGKAMYLSTEGTGTYQVVFFSVLKRLADNSTNENDLKQELLTIKDKLNLNDTDSGQYKAIIENKPFP